MKCNVSKGLLMTALITGSVLWGAQAYLLKNCKSIRWTKWLLRQRERKKRM